MTSVPTTVWSTLEDDQVTTEAVTGILSQVHDDVWVASACVDRFLGDVEPQRALLSLGLSRTDRAIERCQSVVSLSNAPEDSSDSKRDVLASHFQNVPSEALLCHLRSVLLRRLDRLNTYIKMEEKFPQILEPGVNDAMEEWEDDPWGDAASSSELTTQTKHTKEIPISLPEFLQNDLLWSACELSSLGAFEALQVLLQKHGAELWPKRFRVQDCIPEHIHPSLCKDVLPAFDHSLQKEEIYIADNWRNELDFSELPYTQQAIWCCLPPSTVILDADKKIDCLCIGDPLTAEQLSYWYKSRVDYVISSTGMIDIALAVVQHGASQGLPLLDELGEELSLLSRLVYDAPQGSDLQDDWTLANWRSMDPLSVVRAYLVHSSPDTVVRDITSLVMPYLFVLEARAERAGTPDPLLPTRLLYDYILTTSLECVAAIFEASKPTLPSSQRVIRSDEDMAKLALACLYASDSLTEWSTMSNIFECLPVWDISRSGDNNEEAADTTIASLGAFVTPNTNQPPCTAQDLLLFFQPLPIASLSRALDVLDVHLESGEILSRWNSPAPLRWFLQSSNNVKEQQARANRMARRVGEKEDMFNGIEDWEWLLEDMWKLIGNGDNADTAGRGAFCLLSREEISRIFLSGLLSTGNFAIAKSMLYGPLQKLNLSPEIIEEVCLTSSHEFYDNASSGNYKSGDMKLAYDCLDVPPLSETIVKEKEFIEATSRISSFNIPSKPGFTLSPIEIRLTKDRLSLISRVISSNNDTYKHTQVLLDLVGKLGYQNDPVAEAKVLAMIADTALQAEDFSRAYENCERMVQNVAALRKASISTVDEKVQGASEVCWIACFQLGRQQEFTDISRKMELLGHALEFCPSDKIHDVLTAWRKLESEEVQSREEKLQRKRSGEAVVVNSRGLNSIPSNVASSLRARLQDFHMPSPPLLSTPDAAALASRTFKTVTANFPFAVGHRGRSQYSDVDESTSLKSGGSRRSDVDDVSSQASRALSKGIGWLIGADEDL